MQVWSRINQYNIGHSSGSLYIHTSTLWFQASAKGVNETSLFWNFTQHRLVFVTDVLVQTFGPIFKCEAVHVYCLTLKMGLRGYPEMLITNYRSLLPKIPEKRRYHTSTSFIKHNILLCHCIQTLFNKTE